MRLNTGKGYCQALGPSPNPLDPRNRLVLHDQGEDYQQSIAFKSSSSQVCQGASLSSLPNSQLEKSSIFFMNEVQNQTLCLT